MVRIKHALAILYAAKATDNARLFLRNKSTAVPAYNRETRLSIQELIFFFVEISDNQSPNPYRRSTAQTPPGSLRLD